MEVYFRALMKRSLQKVRCHIINSVPPLNLNSDFFVLLKPSSKLPEWGVVVILDIYNCGRREEVGEMGGACPE